MTSANVVEYRVFDKNNKEVGNHRIHLMVKSNPDEFSKYTPASEFTIQAHGYDEEDEYYEEEPEPLNNFLDMGLSELEKWINKNGNGLYTSYSVKDKNDKFTPVISIKHVERFIRERDYQEYLKKGNE